MWQLQTAIWFRSRILWVRNSDSNRGRACVAGWLAPGLGRLNWLKAIQWPGLESSGGIFTQTVAGWCWPLAGTSFGTINQNTHPVPLSRCLGLILGGWAQDRWASKSEYSWKPAVHCPTAPDLTWRPYSGHCFQMLADLPQTLSNPGTLSERRAKETAAVFFKNHLI